MRNLSNLLVTGGSGFIGSAFIRTLLRSSFRGRIVNLDALTYATNPEALNGFEQHPRYRFMQGDINNTKLVEELCLTNEIDAIIHFAAETHVDRSIASPLPFFEANVKGTLSLLEVVRRYPHLHFHHVSTDEVYGSLGASGAFNEQSPYQPNSPYSASKAASDHFVRAYTKTYGLSTTISHCSNNYGPFQHPEKLIPLMIANGLNKKLLPVYGKGDNVRDWLYVDDHVEAVWTIAQRGRSGETYDVGGGTEKTNLQLLHLLIELLADAAGVNALELHNLICYVPDRLGHDFRYAIDSTKLETELGWKPKVALREGLRKTVGWAVGQRASTLS
ncbi:MAG TPA: dTDP-glucose 4,6-dehydratase [Chlamydiales bacterium]|jgi:dTDP-glucose 4,6-dehydratase